MVEGLVNEWDKVFPQSTKVNHRKVTFKNHFGINLVADMYEPKEYAKEVDIVISFFLCEILRKYINFR